MKPDLYDPIEDKVLGKSYEPAMTAEVRDEKYSGWQDAVRRVRS